MITLPFSLFTPNLDPDAKAFINAAGLTTLDQINAINNLVISLKDAGIWVKMDAAYPFIGGTASSCKFNLKDPVDSDAAYRITFSGSWTINSSGVKPTTASNSNYADTHYTVSAITARNNEHHYYRYINNVNSVSCNYAGAGPSPYLIMGSCSELEWFSGNASISLGGVVSGTAGFSQGLTRQSSTLLRVYRKLAGGSFAQFFSDITSAVGTINSNTMYIGATNFGGGSTNFAEEMRYGFLSYGQDLTPTQMLNLDAIVTTFNSALGRTF